MFIRRTRVSDGATALRNALVAAGVTCQLSNRETFTTSRLVMNWGSSAALSARGRVLNQPSNIGNATNKFQCFDMLQRAGVVIPSYSTTPPAVTGSGIWLARTTITGSGGEGIVVLRAGVSVPNAPLYVKYIRKTREYRVHVLNGKVVGVQQKRKEAERELTADEKLIRNRNNGWVFCVNDVEIVPNELEQISTAATNAVRALGLDFGAVDLVISRDDNLPYVLEVNTAPGLQSPTILAGYVAGLQEVLRDG